MMTSPINVFQRLARQWDAMHPYNAAQILKIDGSATPSALQQAWHDALNDLGLGRVRIDGTSFSFECLNGEMSLYGVKVVPAGTKLEDYISEQLNRRFDNPAEPPFRPFVLFENGYYYAGVVYHHWVADSVSIRKVLREWFVRLYDPKNSCRKPIELADGGYRRFFSIMRSGSAVGQGLLTATRWASSLRQARRVEERSDLSVRFAIRSLPSSWIDNVLAGARQREVTLNDVFMAGLAMVCDRHVPLKHRPRRHSIAVGSIVDLRPYSEEQLNGEFGLFLGFTNVVCRPGELRDPEKLVKFIARHNEQQKRIGIPQASALRMLAGVAAGKFMKPERMLHFYQKHLPLAGGISNVNMNRSWATAYHPSPLLDYIRVSPTGPMMPLVFATTTLGNSFHFGVTYRPSIVPVETIEAMAAMYVESVGAYAR
jgi:hypothetical protein